MMIITGFILFFPQEIVSLNLVELSLRNNPLVVRFIEEMVYEPPSLLELAGRVIKVKNVPYTQEDLPLNLTRYLDSAHRCVNPKCKGKAGYYFHVYISLHSNTRLEPELYSDNGLSG